MNGHFRLTVWDPALILSQIVALQSLFYATYGALLICGSVFSGTELTLSNIFSYKAINVSDRHGVMTVVCYAVNALAGSVGLWVIVQRTKQCLDFSATCYLIHLLNSLLYNGSLPDTIYWWILNIVLVTITCVCGEFLCLKTELTDIPLLGAKVDL